MPAGGEALFLVFRGFGLWMQTRPKINLSARGGSSNADALLPGAPRLRFPRFLRPGNIQRAIGMNLRLLVIRRLRARPFPRYPSRGFVRQKDSHSPSSPLPSATVGPGF